MKLLAIAGALAGALAWPAVASTARAAQPSCTLAAARQAIRATHLLMPLGGSPVRVDPVSADRVLCHDFTRDGRVDLAVTIASGGTAGDIGFAVFRSTSAGWRVALTRSGYKIGIFRAGGDIVGSQPVYDRDDPNCCPTGGFDHTRYHWSGKRFVAVRSWHTSSFRP